MAKAIEQGIPKLRIEEAAARTQARIDGGQQTRGRRQQVPARPSRGHPGAQGRQHGRARAPDREAGAAAGASATSSPAAAALDALTALRRDRRGQPARAVDRRRRGRGPRSARSPTALEKVWGRHVAEIRSIAGVYAAEVGRARERTHAPATGRGVRRRPRAGGRAS